MNHYAVYPPSMTRSLPVTNFDSSESKYSDIQRLSEMPKRMARLERLFPGLDIRFALSVFSVNGAYIWLGGYRVYPSFVLRVE